MVAVLVCYNEGMEENTYTLKQASLALGVSVYEVRHYCDRGLVRGVRRRRNGYRYLSEKQLEWVGILVMLRKCGFGIKEMKKYVRLAEQGEGTLQERKAMLETQKRQLWQEIYALQEGIDTAERLGELMDTDSRQNAE